MNRPERSSASQQRLPHQACGALERRKVASVLDDVIASCPLEGRGHLGRHYSVGLGRRQPPRRKQPCPADRLGRVHQYHCVEGLGVIGFEKQGNVADHNPVALCTRLSEQLQPPPVDLRVDDPVEISERRLVGQHPGPERGPVEAPITEDHLGPETRGDVSQHGLARCLGFAHQLVGVNQSRPPTLKESSNCGFAGGDVTSERNGECQEYGLLQQRRLIFIFSRHLVAMPAPCLVALPPPDHDSR